MISMTSEGPDNDSLSQELTVSESDEEDAANLEKLITNPEPENQPESSTPIPSTSKDSLKSTNPTIEEYEPSTSKPLTFPRYHPSTTSRSSTPRRKTEERPEARRYVPTNELLYDLNYIVNKINQNVGLAMYAMVAEGLVKRYR